MATLRQIEQSVEPQQTECKEKSNSMKAIVFAVIMIVPEAEAKEQKKAEYVTP